MNADAKLIHGILSSLAERISATDISITSWLTTLDDEHSRLSTHLDVTMATDGGSPRSTRLILPIWIEYRNVVRAILDLEGSHGVRNYISDESLAAHLPKTSIRERFIEMTN